MNPTGNLGMRGVEQPTLPQTPGTTKQNPLPAIQKNVMNGLREITSSIKKPSSENMQALKNGLYGAGFPLLIPFIVGKAIIAAGANVLQKHFPAKNDNSPNVSAKKADVPAKKEETHNVSAKKADVPVLSPEKQAQVDKLKDKINKAKMNIQESHSFFDSLKNKARINDSDKTAMSDIQFNIKTEENKIVSLNEKIKYLEATPTQLAKTARAAEASIPSKMSSSKREEIENLKDQKRHAQQDIGLAKNDINQLKKDLELNPNQEKISQKISLKEEKIAQYEEKIAITNMKIVNILNS